MKFMNSPRRQFQNLNIYEVRNEYCITRVNWNEERHGGVNRSGMMI